MSKISPPPSPLSPKKSENQLAIPQFRKDDFFPSPWILRPVSCDGRRDFLLLLKKGIPPPRLPIMILPSR